MWLETKKARNFNAVVWVLGEVNGYGRHGSSPDDPFEPRSGRPIHSEKSAVHQTAALRPQRPRLRLHPVRLFDHLYAPSLQGGATNHQAMKRLLGVVRCRAITSDDVLKVEANRGSWCHAGRTFPAAKHRSSRSTCRQIGSRAGQLALQACQRTSPDSQPRYSALTPPL